MSRFLNEYYNGWKICNLKWLYKNKLKSLQIAINMTILAIVDCIICFGDDLKDVKIVECFLIPALLVVWSIKLHPVEKDKMYYLLPMSLEQRIAEKKSSYLKRIAIHMIAFIIGDIISLIFIHFNVASMLLLLIIELIFSSIIFAGEEKGYIYIINICYFFAFYMLVSAQLVANDNNSGIFATNCICYGILIVVIAPIWIKYIKKVMNIITAENYYEVTSNES